MSATILDQNELYASFNRRDRRSVYVQRGDEADDDPEDPTEYQVKGRVEPTASFTALEGGADVADFETWVVLMALAFTPDWVDASDLDSGDTFFITAVSATDALNFAGLIELTVQFKVKFDSVPPTGETWRLVGQWDAGGDEQWVVGAYEGTDSKVGLEVAINGFNLDAGIDPAGIEAGIWYDVGVVIKLDEPVAADKIKVYVDGVEGVNFNSGDADELPDGSDDTSIGGTYNSGNFLGKIQDVRIWTTAKSGTFVANNMFTWLEPAALANLAAWWPLDGDGDDYSGNGNDLSSTGTPTYVDGMPGLAPFGEIEALAEYAAKTYSAQQAPKIKMRLAHWRNILPNPSFERDDDKWTVLTGTPGFNAVGAFGGRSWGGNGNGSGNQQEMEREVTLTPQSLSSLGARYIRTSFLRKKATAGTTDTVQVRVRTYDSGAGLLDTYDSTATNPASDTSWERVIAMTAANANTDSAKATCKLVELSGGGGLEPNVYLDELDVRLDNIYDCFVGGPAAACLSNANFNTNTTGWTISPGGSWARVTTNLHEGAGNVQCSTDGELSQVGTLPSGYDDEGDVVVLLCARRDSAATEKTNIRLEILDSADAVLAYKESGSLSVFGGSGNPWKKRGVAVRIPDPTKLGGSGAVKVKLRFIGDIGAGADSRVDDIQCFVAKGRGRA